MSDNDVPRSVTSLLERVRRKLTLDRLEPFILPFALWAFSSVMFSIVFVLALRNIELAQITTTRIVEVQETVAAEAATQKASLLQVPTPVTIIVTRPPEIRVVPVEVPVEPHYTIPGLGTFTLSQLLGGGMGLVTSLSLAAFGVVS
jgi:hypothetical protein